MKGLAADLDSKPFHFARESCIVEKVFRFYADFLTESPTETVLFWYIHMYGRFADAELLCGAAHGGARLHHILPQRDGALLRIPFHAHTTPHAGGLCACRQRRPADLRVPENVYVLKKELFNFRRIRLF